MWVQSKRAATDAANERSFPREGELGSGLYQDQDSRAAGDGGLIADETSIPIAGSADLVDLVDEALADADPVNRSLAFAKLLEHFDGEDAGGIFELLQEGGAEQSQITLFLFAWGRKDPHGALEFADGGMRGDVSEWFRGQILAGWASTDPQSAINWLSTHEDSDVDPGRRARYLEESLIRGLVSHDIDVATDYVLQSIDPTIAKKYLESFAQKQLKRRSFDVVLEWGERLPPGEGKARVLDRVAYAYAERDLAAATNWVEKYASKDWAAAVVSRVAEEWAEDDSLATAEWLESLPQGAGRDRASYTAFREWMRRDAAGASAFIAGMEHSSAKDHAVAALIENLGDDPEAAAVWAMEIGEPEMREEVLNRTVRDWLRRDEAAANAWLEKNKLK